jgi:hypothetical protein
MNRTEEQLRELERSLAYEHPSGLLDSCFVKKGDDDGRYWIDLERGEYGDFESEIAYLDSRGLLERHPQHAHWVCVRDESEEEKA